MTIFFLTNFLSLKCTFKFFKRNSKQAFNDHILKIRNSITKFKTNKNLGTKYDFWKKSKNVEYMFLGE